MLEVLDAARSPVARGWKGRPPSHGGRPLSFANEAGDEVVGTWACWPSTSVSTLFL